MAMMSVWFLLSILILYSVASDLLVAQGLSKGAPLVDVKCSKCHTLKRVFIVPRSEGEWRGIIEKMMNKNPEWIRPAEAGQIFQEILTLRPERVQAMDHERKDYEDSRLLLIDRCTVCHNTNRILIQDKTPEEWKETVERMRSESMGYITEEDAKRIVGFLSQRVEILKEDAGAKIFVGKCLICHPGEQILLETHDRAGWEVIIGKMKEIAYKTFRADWFGPSEAKLIVDLLVKTQGTKD
jgi:cytochrome c5